MLLVISFGGPPMPDNNVMFEAVAPIVPANSLEEALEYYQHVLGFQIAWKWGDPARLASVCRERVELNLSESDAVGGTPARMYIRMVGVESYYNALLDAGVKPAVALAERAYGLRDFRIIDPSG